MTRGLNIRYFMSAVTTPKSKMAATSRWCHHLFSRSCTVFYTRRKRFYCTETDWHALHVPVMLKECLSFLSPKDGQVFVDGTFGAGGHTTALLMAAKCSVYALDRDPDAIDIAQVLQAGRPEFKDRLFPLHGRFSEILSLLRAKQVKDESVHGMLLDIGVSSMQFDDPLRGFSLSQDGPLDMRMDCEAPSSKSGKVTSFTAADVVNSINEGELTAVLREYGQEREAARISRAIVHARRKDPIVSTKQLASIVANTIGYGRKDKLSRFAHPATKTFQALRILVNDELNELQQALKAAQKLLCPGGRLVVISFHSLEDSIVKHFFKEAQSKVGVVKPGVKKSKTAKTSTWLPLHHKKFISPSGEEILLNPRSRSAKLRAAVKTDSLVLDLTELTNLPSKKPNKSPLKEMPL